MISLSIHKSLMSLRNPQIFLRSRHRCYAAAARRRVLTAYDPLTGRLVAERVGQNQESESASGDQGQRTCFDDGDRTYRNVKKPQPEEEGPDFEGFSSGWRAQMLQLKSQLGVKTGGEEYMRSGSGFKHGQRGDYHGSYVNSSGVVGTEKGEPGSEKHEDIKAVDVVEKSDRKVKAATEEEEKKAIGTDDLDRGGTKVSVKKASRSHFDKGVKDSSRERASEVLENGVGQGFSVGDVVKKKKKAKMSVLSWIQKRPYEELPIPLTDVNRGINKLEWRIPLPGSFGSEVARVLGGGLVPGSLVLVGGDPGVGKSTLILQIAALIAQGQDSREPGPVVYVSGEESVEQIGNRADRVKIETKDLFLYSSTDIEDMLAKTHSLSPRLLIVDSIQTVYLQNVTGSAGGITQVKECTAALLRYAKKTNVPVLLIGHVTKNGNIAGPRVLEHIVDVVLYLEGEKCTSLRLLRSVKNRFGSTDELGVFEMTQLGLEAVLNPSEMYLTEQPSDSEFLVGLAVAVIMDGTRTFLIEIQALCVLADLTRSRQYNGIQTGRAAMIISVINKQAGLKLRDFDIFLNVVSGFKLRETSGDLPIAVAICSSVLEFPIPSGVAFIGEISLSGELRTVPRIDTRLNTVAKLGYKKCIVPKSSLKSLKGLDHKGLQIIGCSSLEEVYNTVFTSSKTKALT